MRGSRYASVLPLPVCAASRKSPPDMMAGTARDCACVGGGDKGGWGEGGKGDKGSRGNVRGRCNASASRLGCCLSGQRWGGHYHTSHVTGIRGTVCRPHLMVGWGVSGKRKGE
jgi:hypothetical protein